MAYSDLSPDFSWLGNLPDTYDAARIKSMQRDILSTLDPSSPDSLDKHAARLYAAGDFAGGQTLTNEALQRRELARKIAYDQQYIKALPAFLATMKGGAPTAPAGVSPDEPGYNIYADPAKAAPRPSPFTAPTPLTPGSIPSPDLGPRTELPPQLGRPDLAGLRSNIPQEPTPSEQIIMAAQQGGLPQPERGPQFAQAGGPSALPGGQLSVTPSPSGVPRLEATRYPPWLAGGAASFAPGGAAPMAPPEAAGPAPITGLRPEATAQEQFKYFITAAGSLPPNAPAQRQALMNSAAEALGRAKMTDERRNWALEQIDNKASGRPLQNFSVWSDQKKVLPANFDAGIKAYGTVADKTRQATAFEGTLNTLQSIVEHPKFTSGEGTALIAHGQKLLRNVKDTMVANGVPLPPDIVNQVDSATTNVQLREAFQSLSNTAIFDRLGSLGNQISEGDRNFVQLSFPSLLLSRDSNRLIIQYYKAVVEQQKGLGAEIDKLKRDRGPYLGPEDVNTAVRDYVDSHPIAFDKEGNPTSELGKRLKALADSEAAKAAPVAPPAPTAPAMAPAGSTVYDAAGKPHRLLPNGSVVPMTPGAL